VATLTSCNFPTQDVSNEYPFSSYLGCRFQLSEEMSLRKRSKNKYRFVEIGLFPYDYDSFYGEIIEKVTVGTMIILNEVKMVEIDGYKSIYAIGQIIGKNDSFEIAIGGCQSGEPNLQLRKMPWKNDPFQKRRSVPWEGCK